MLEKIYRLAHLLREISKAEISNILVLKGGTAINYIYFDIPRLSEDIDMNYIGSGKKEDMQKDRKWIDKILTKIFEINGYTITKKQSYIMLKYDLGYTGVHNNKDRLRIEINFLERIPVFPIIKHTFRHLFDLQSFKVNSYRIEELMAGKLRALLERGSPRDIFDIYNLENKEFDKNLLRKLFVFYVCMVMDFRKATTAYVEDMDESIFENDICAQLPRRITMSLNPVKRNVIKFVKDLMKLKVEEYKFVSELYDNNNYQPDILFQGYQTNNIITHPSILLVLNKLQIKERK